MFRLKPSSVLRPQLLLWTVLTALYLFLGVACVNAHAQVVFATFTFPSGKGWLRLWDAPCANGKIISLYADNVPEPFRAGVLNLHGRVLTGCWYQADGRVFFTDSEAALLIPPPRIELFTPGSANNNL